MLKAYLTSAGVQDALICRFRIIYILSSFMLLQPVQGLPLLEPKITNNVRVKMVNSIQNSPETPQIDSCLSP